MVFYHLLLREVLSPSDKPFGGERNMFEKLKRLFTDEMTDEKAETLLHLTRYDLHLLGGWLEGKVSDEDHEEYEEFHRRVDRTLARIGKKKFDGREFHPENWGHKKIE